VIDKKPPENEPVMSYPSRKQLEELYEHQRRQLMDAQAENLQLLSELQDLSGDSKGLRECETALQEVGASRHNAIARLSEKEDELAACRGNQARREVLYRDARNRWKASRGEQRTRAETCEIQVELLERQLGETRNALESLKRTMRDTSHALETSTPPKSASCCESKPTRETCALGGV
jgi:chaperonin cofactor prefoldin